MALFGGPKKDVEHGLRPGFRDLRWGDLPRKNMTVLDDTGDDRFCLIDGDDLSFGGATVDRIVYRYWQGRLAEVLVEIPAPAADAVFKSIVGDWGKPERPNAFIDDYFWQNRKQGVEATGAVFSKNPGTKAATLTISSRYIQAKRLLVPQPAAPPAP
jgi:hypothetical protein